MKSYNLHSAVSDFFVLVFLRFIFYFNLIVEFSCSLLYNIEVPLCEYIKIYLLVNVCLMGIWAVSKFGNYNNNAVNVMSFDEHMYTL